MYKILLEAQQMKRNITLKIFKELIVSLNIYQPFKL